MTPVPLPTLPAAGTLLALLVTGHLVADFLLQSEAMARSKTDSGGVLLSHAGLVLGAHALLLVPLWGAPRAAALCILAAVILTALHLLVDAVKRPLERAGSRPLLLLVADQGVHLIAILVAWRVLLGRAVVTTPLVPPAWLPHVGGWAVIAAGLIVNANGGTVVVRKLLTRYPTLVPAEDGGAPVYAMGRTIGVLERILTFVLVLLNQWGALGLVLAAKSIARYPELKQRHFAEYYLIGTLASILVAVVSGVVVQWAVL